MKNEKNNNYKFDYNENLKKQFRESEVINYAITLISIAGGLIVLGYGFKILNFTLLSFKNLNHTLKL
jgi:hypothetical protein